MGKVTLAREDARAVWIQTLDRERLAGRRLRRSQTAETAGNRAGGLLTLAIGIGLNKGLFTVFNALAPLLAGEGPGARCVGLQRLEATAGPGGFGVVEYRYLPERTKTFSGLIAMRELHDVSSTGEKCPVSTSVETTSAC